MKEDDIRPSVYMQLAKEAAAEDLRFLLSEKDAWDCVPCPACNSNEYEVFGEKDSVQYVECHHCQTIYINPRPSENLLHRYYLNSKHYEIWNNHIFPESDAVRRNTVYHPRADFLVDYCQKNGIMKGASLLEVGAGYGSFCDVIQTTGFFGKVTAVEPTPSLARHCKELGLNVISDFAEHAVSGNQCNVFCAYEVIEHVYSPLYFLKNAYDVITENGLIALSCPNPWGFDLAMLGLEAANFHYGHLNYFHPDSIKRLLKNVGFQNVEVLTPGKLDVDIVKKYAHQVCNSTGVGMEWMTNKFFRQLLFEKDDSVREEFQVFCAKNGLSSHMMVFATKPSVR